MENHSKKIVALLGGNGAGKSTTLKAISTMLAAERGKVTKGSINYDGTDARWEFLDTGHYGFAFRNDGSDGMSIRVANAAGTADGEATLNVYQFTIDGKIKVGGNVVFHAGNDGSGSNLNAEQNLTFDGTKLTIGNSNISSGTHTFTASAGSAESINTTAIGDATTIEYTIFLVNSTNYQSQKVLIMDNGSTAYIEEYAVMSNPNLIGTFSADVNSGNVRLLLTPQTGISGTTTVKFTKMTIQ